MVHTSVVAGASDQGRPRMTNDRGVARRLGGLVFLYRTMRRRTPAASAQYVAIRLPSPIQPASVVRADHLPGTSDTRLSGVGVPEAGRRDPSFEGSAQTHAGAGQHLEP